MNFNQWLASKITSAVSTMWCAYLFALIALISLPAALKTHSLIVIVAWVAQTFLQLVLLSVIMVGQKIQTKVVQTHVDNHQNEIQRLHSLLRSDINKIHNHLGISKEPSVMDEIKQHIEEAIVAAEAAIDSNPAIQAVKDKLTEVREFLKTLDVQADVQAEVKVEEPAPVAPVETPVPVDVQPAEDAAPTPPVEIAPAPVNTPPESIAPAPVNGIVQPDATPVTDEAGNAVSDPNAAR